MSTELIKKFEFCVDYMSNKFNNYDILSDDDKLNIYKFFKQATIGNINIPQPYFYQIKEVAKWNAWNSVLNMSKEDAMINYNKIVSNIYFNI